MSATAGSSAVADVAPSGRKAPAATSPCRASARINSSALETNAAIVRKLAGSANVCAVVKANAYGHGMQQVVPILAPKVDSFAVATLAEGRAVRELTRHHDIMVLSEFNHPEQVSVFEQRRLQPVIHQREQVRWLMEQGGIQTRCWIKIDTGMNRLGIRPQELAEIYHQLSHAGCAELGLMSHFACADEPDDPMNTRQLKLFDEVTAAFNVVYHTLRGKV